MKLIKSNDLYSKDECIKCKLTDCVEVCQLTVFTKVKTCSHKSDEYIDCGVEPECPIEHSIRHN